MRGMGQFLCSKSFSNCMRAHAINYHRVLFKDERKRMAMATAQWSKRHHNAHGRINHDDSERDIWKFIILNTGGIDVDIWTLDLHCLRWDQCVLRVVSREPKAATNHKSQ